MDISWFSLNEWMEKARMINEDGRLESSSYYKNSYKGMQNYYYRRCGNFGAPWLFDDIRFCPLFVANTGADDDSNLRLDWYFIVSNLCINLCTCRDALSYSKSSIVSNDLFWLFSCWTFTSPNRTCLGATIEQLLTFRKDNELGKPRSTWR